MGRRTIFAIANHFNSKGGDDPIFGRFQPPIRSSEVQRHQQAAIVNAFVDDLLDADRHARVVVLGDINDFQFSETVSILKGARSSTSSTRCRVSSATRTSSTATRRRWTRSS